MCVTFLFAELCYNLCSSSGGEGLTHQAERRRHSSTATKRIVGKSLGLRHDGTGA